MEAYLPSHGDSEPFVATHELPLATSIWRQNLANKTHSIEAKKPVPRRLKGTDEFRA